MTIDTVFNSVAPSGGQGLPRRRPHLGAPSPRFVPRRGAAACALAAAVMAVTAGVLGACATNDDSQVASPVVVGLGCHIDPDAGAGAGCQPDLPAFYSDGELTIYQSQRPVSLPVRPPTDADKSGLGAQPPYPRAPYLLDGDMRVEVRFTLSNLDDQDRMVELLLDPWNEFARYHATVQVINDDETAPNFSGYDRFFTIPAQSRITGVITADDTHEMAVDLATVQAILAKPPGPDATIGANALINHVFNLQNRSNGGDLLVTPYIPSVIAGLTGFDLGLRTYVTANVAVEIEVDATDVNGNRLLANPADKPLGPPGKVISAPAAASAG